MYDRGGQWLPTPTELTSQRAERLATQLRALGVEPEGEESRNFMIFRPIQSYSI